MRQMPKGVFAHTQNMLSKLGSLHVILLYHSIQYGTASRTSDKQLCYL